MKKIILKMHVSLDGHVRAADGDVMGWVFRTYDDELTAWEVDGLQRAGVHVMGRRLYQEMAAHWPTSTEPFAPAMNDLPKVVFSRTLTHADWGPTRIVGGDIAGELARMQAEPGGDILVHGGAALAQGLSARGLIDEYRLVLHPVALGGGLELFAEPMDLSLVDVRRFPAGAVALTYRRAS